MKRKTKVLIYLTVLFFMITLTFSATWIFLTKVNGDSDIYQYGVILTKELYKYKNNTYYYGPKDSSSKEINYNNGIIKKDDLTGRYKLIITLNDEENTSMKDNYFFYKNYFYLINRDITIYNLMEDKPLESKRVYKGYFEGNANVSKIYGIKKEWIYIKVKLFKESDNRNWYEDKYFKIKFDTCDVYEIPYKLLPEFK